MDLREDVDQSLADRERDLRERAGDGDPSACRELAELLLAQRARRSVVDVAFDQGDEAQLDEVRELYRSAAEAGDIVAQYHIGQMHYKGWYGAPHDYRVAFRWLQRAAGDGYQEAQYRLFLMHRDGTGAPQNFVRAHVWLNLCSASWGPIIDDWPTAVRPEALKEIGKTVAGALRQLEEKMMP